MRKLLETTLARIIGSIVVLPLLFAFLLIEVFRPWVIRAFFFGSGETAIVLAIVLSALPLLTTLGYLLAGLRSSREVGI